MSDFLLFEYWQTVANAWRRTFSLFPPAPDALLFVFALVGCPGPKNDKCVGSWLKLWLKLAYFPLNQKANKCRALWFRARMAVAYRKLAALLSGPGRMTFDGSCPVARLFANNWQINLSKVIGRFKGRSNKYFLIRWRNVKYTYWLSIFFKEKLREINNINHKTVWVGNPNIFIDKSLYFMTSSCRDVDKLLKMELSFPAI